MSINNVNKRSFAIMIVATFIFGVLSPLIGTVETVNAEAETVFYDYFEDGLDNKWTYSGLWTTSDYKQYESTSGKSAYYGNTSTNTYETGDQTSGTMISSIPANLLAAEQAFISFYYYLDIETDEISTGFELAQVSISTTGNDGNANWIPIANLTDTGYEWSYITIDLTEIATGSVMYIKFEFDSWDGIDNDQIGWFIDTIRVFTGFEGHGFLLQNKDFYTPISNPSDSEDLFLNAEGFIDIVATPNENKIQGINLAPSAAEYIVRPNTTLSFSMLIQNYDTDPTNEIVAGIKVYNRFGNFVFGDSKTATLNGSPSADDQWKPVLQWTPTLYDNYIVYAYTADATSIPLIDPYTQGGEEKIQYRLVSVMEEIMNDDVEGPDDAWEAQNSNTRGDWQKETDFYHSMGTSWHGGDFPIVTGSVTNYLNSDIINVADLYWVYSDEIADYPNKLYGGSDKTHVYISFYYCYAFEPFIFGYSEGTLQTKVFEENSTNQGEWHTIWDTASDTHFSPETKLNWSDRLTNRYDIPTMVDITDYLNDPDGYNPDTRMQFRFVVQNQGISSSAGWFLDDLRILGVIPEPSLIITDTNSPKTVTNDTDADTPVFTFTVANTGNTGGATSIVSIEDSIISRPPGCSYDFSTTEFPLSGGSKKTINIRVTTAPDTPPGIYPFTVWANTTTPYGELTTNETLVLRIGAGNLTVSANITEQTVGPGENASYLLDIANTVIDAPADRTITLSVPSQSGWIIWFEDQLETMSFTLASHENRTVKVNVTAPEDALAEEFYNATITVVNGPLSDEINTDNIPVYLNTSVSAVRKLSLSAEPVKASPGEQASILVAAKNEGNLNGDVVLEVTSVDDPLVVQNVSIPTAASNIPAFSTVSFTVRLEVPSDIEHGLYAVNLTGNMTGNILDHLTVYFNVSEPYIIDIVPDETTVNQTAVWSSNGYNELTYNFTAYNNGSTITGIAFGITGTGDSEEWVSDIPLLWNVNNTSDNNGEEIEFQLDLPDDIEAGDYTITINASATGNPFLFDMEEFYLTVPARYDVELSSQLGETTIDPVTNEQVRLTITNAGNVEDTILLSHDLGNNWTTHFETTDGITITELVDMEAFEVVDVYFVFNASLDVSSGVTTVEILASSEGNSSVEAPFQIDLTVNQKYGVLLTGTSTSKSFDPEGTAVYAEFRFSVENNGNTAGNVDFTHRIFLEGTELTATERNAWDIMYKAGTSTSTSTYLDQGEEESITVEVTPPEDARAGIYTIDVTGSSLTEQDSLDLTLDLEAVHDMSIVLSKTKLTMDAGTSQNIIVQLINNGNIDESVSINIDATGDASATWVSVASPVAVLSGEDATVTLTLTVPEGVKTDEYTFTVTINATGVSPDTETFKADVAGSGFFPGISGMELGIILVVLVVVAALIALALRSRKPPMPPQGPPQNDFPPPEAPEAPPEMQMRV